MLRLILKLLALLVSEIMEQKSFRDGEGGGGGVSLKQINDASFVLK